MLDVLEGLEYTQDQEKTKWVSPLTEEGGLQSLILWGKGKVLSLNKIK